MNASNVSFSVRNHNRGVAVKSQRETLPSQTFDEFWLWAFTKRAKLMGKHVGKWLVFVSVKDMDQMWKVVREATLQEKLGIGAKVATMRPNSHAKDENTKVICVYTVDYRNKVDVLRVRKALRELGVLQTLSYKTDEATYAGRYASSSHVSKYRSNGSEDELIDLDDLEEW